MGQQLELPLVPSETTTERPRTRGDCIGGLRPCPFVSCRHHIFPNADPRVRGRQRLRAEPAEPAELAETCSLDVARSGGATLDEVATLMGISRERVRQIEVAALAKLRRKVDAR